MNEHQDHDTQLWQTNDNGMQLRYCAKCATLYTIDMLHSSFKCTCPRDRTTFTATPRSMPSPEGEYHVVDCPTCHRGYVRNVNGFFECEPGRILRMEQL